jgi:hypothetical protein
LGYTEGSPSDHDIHNYESYWGQAGVRGFIAAFDNIRGDSINTHTVHPSFHPINIYERFMSIQQEAGLKQYITARYNIRQPLIISVCTEMEFLNDNFSQGFWALTQVF